MKLMTKVLCKRFKEVGRQEGVSDPITIAKFFNPCGRGKWYATEFNPDDECFFGYVTGLGYDEWGYFSLQEMEAVKLPFGMGIERDLYFDEKPISKIIK